MRDNDFDRQFRWAKTFDPEMIAIAHKNARGRLAGYIEDTRYGRDYIIEAMHCCFRVRKANIHESRWRCHITFQCGWWKAGCGHNYPTEFEKFEAAYGTHIINAIAHPEHPGKLISWVVLDTEPTRLFCADRDNRARILIEGQPGFRESAAWTKRKNGITGEWYYSIDVMEIIAQYPRALVDHSDNYLPDVPAAKQPDLFGMAR